MKKATTKKTKIADPNKPLSNTKNWYADRYQTVFVQRNILAAITLIALVATLISSYSVAQLTPLKSVQPFVIQVDDKSGQTQVVNPLSNKEIMANQAIKQYFVAKYVRARESYDQINYQDNYANVRVMSDPLIFKEYQKFMSPDNPDSPVVVFGLNGRRIVDMSSLTIVNDNAAQVRMTIRPEGRPNKSFEPKSIIIWLTFDFVPMDLTEKERYIDPVGFRVTSYTIDDDLTAITK